MFLFHVLFTLKISCMHFVYTFIMMLHDRIGWDVQMCCTKIQPLLCLLSVFIFIRIYVCACVFVWVRGSYCVTCGNTMRKKKTERKTNSKVDKAIIITQPNLKSTCTKTIEMSTECTKVK